MIPFKKSWLMGILVAVVLVVYSGAFSAPFVWDDEEMVVGNPLIQKLSNIPTIFTSGPFMEKWDAGQFYRPMQTVSYTLDYAIWGGAKAPGFHATNVVIHVASTLMVMLVLEAFGLGTMMAFWAALIWGVHPMNIEAVTYVSGRGDALFMLCSLLSIWAWIKAVNGKGHYYPAAILAWGVAILSKENALPVPLIMSVYLMLRPQPQGEIESESAPWSNRNHHFLNLALVGGYIVFRLLVLKGGQSEALSWIASSVFWERVWTFPYIIFTYLRLWFLPYPLHMEYHYVAESLMDPYIWIGLPIVGGLFYGFWKLVDRRDFWFYGAWVALGLGPVDNIVLPLAATLREHWFYLSGIAMSVLCLKAAATLYARYRLCCKMPKSSHFRFPHLDEPNRVKRQMRALGILLTSLFLQNWVPVAAGVLVVLVLSGVSMVRNEDWQDALDLYEHDLQFEPRSFLLHNNVGVEYFRRQDFVKAKAAFKASIENSPSGGYGTAYNNYGVILENEGKINEAIEAFQTSINLSRYPLAYGNLGRVLLTQKRPDQAAVVLEQGVQANPFMPQLRYYLGFAYLQLNQHQRALDVFVKLDALSPGYADTQKIIATLRR